MRVLPTRLSGLVAIEPAVHADERGFFSETYRSQWHAELGLSAEQQFVQDNHSRSARGVVRGLHFHVGDGVAKLVRCGRGRILDVAADIRPASPTYKRWVSAELSGENGSMLYVPPGFAHGFCALEDECFVNYMMTGEFSPAHDAGVRWNDSEIGVEWPITDPILSQKDSNLPFLNEIEGRLRADYETAEEASV